MIALIRAFQVEQAIVENGPGKSYATTSPLPFTCADNDGTEERLLLRQGEYLNAVKENEVIKHVSYGAFLALMAFMTGMGKG